MKSLLAMPKEVEEWRMASGVGCLPVNVRFDLLPANTGVSNRGSKMERLSNGERHQGADGHKR